MRLIALTGGIATGKSTVARMLVARGAVLVDADAIAREVVERGTVAYERIVDRFGDAVVSADGSLDRAALAAIVFADETARADLNAITHPEILAEMTRRIEEHRASERVVVADIPLLLESGPAAGFDAILLVAATPDEQVERMLSERGMSAAEARARLDAQTPTDEKRRHATHVIENNGSLQDLERAVEAFWKEMTA